MQSNLMGDKFWFEILVKLNQLVREKYKFLAIHTHINHLNEITYLIKQAANKLYQSNLFVISLSLIYQMVVEKDLFQLIIIMIRKQE